MVSFMPRLFHNPTPPPGLQLPFVVGHEGSKAVLNTLGKREISVTASDANLTRYLVRVTSILITVPTKLSSHSLSQPNCLFSDCILNNPYCKVDYGTKQLYPIVFHSTVGVFKMFLNLWFLNSLLLLCVRLSILRDKGIGCQGNIGSELPYQELTF